MSENPRLDAATKVAWEISFQEFADGGYENASVVELKFARGLAAAVLEAADRHDTIWTNARFRFRCSADGTASTAAPASPASTASAIPSTHATITTTSHAS